MAQNYTQMWDAFLGGEWGGTALTEDATSADYLSQTRDFYSNIIGPAFGLDDADDPFGSTDLAGAYAQFSNVDFETAERTFRSEIGDPYGGGVGDPFSWEKVSRYNTQDFAGVGRLQDLLEDQLYGQGKFLGGETGADYGTATAKGLETYSSGLRGERESLTYEGLTAGAGIASGTGGSVLRSGESAAVAEDVLIEAYKKAKVLGTDYRAGTAETEQTLSEDLDAALTTYLDAIDEEKERWFSAVLSNVQTFKKLEMEAGLDEDELAAFEYDTLTDEELQAEMSEGLEGMAGTDYYDQWGCGYGQIPDGAGGCVDSTGEGGYEEEVKSYKFRTDSACGIGELWQDNGDGTGQCVVRDDLADLKEDDYGYLCAEGEIDECGNCGGAGPEENYDCAGNCTAGEDCNGVCGGTAIEDECGVCGGDGSSCRVYGCTSPNAQNYNSEATEDDGSCTYLDQEEEEYLFCPTGQEIGPNGDCVDIDEEQPCPQGQIQNYLGNCIPDPELPCTLECPEGQQLNTSACVCYDIWDYERPFS